MNLLTIDWDYFFPIPTQGDQSIMFDWAAREPSSGFLAKLFFVDLWVDRGSCFYQQGMPLPGTSGDEEGFWNRFRFSPGARFFFGESHVDAYRLRNLGNFQEVWNFDAHHDGAYRGTLESLSRQTRVTCEDWTFGYHIAGAKLHMRYPKWKREYRLLDGDPVVPMTRKLDDLKKISRVFDLVYLCRSGAWVPPWLDGQFDAFRKAAPIPVRKWERLGGKIPSRAAVTEEAMRERAEQWGLLQEMMKRNNASASETSGAA